MAFEFTDQHIEDYHTRGYTVFKKILPPSLVADLRKVSERARELARERGGPQIQRLQPVARFDLDQQPFINYGELPELLDAIHRVLSPNHTHANRNILGILLEPADEPYCTNWHRDWRDHVNPHIAPIWEEVFLDTNLFNQVNCALYDDGCTWVVPGSHLRRDLPREFAAFPQRPIPGPDLSGMSAEERERACLAYCRNMPGATKLALEAGDFCLYRNSLWHLGNYVPYQRRATLHDIVDTPEFAAWRDKIAKAR